MSVRLQVWVEGGVLSTFQVLVAQITQEDTRDALEDSTNHTHSFLPALVIIVQVLVLQYHAAFLINHATTNTRAFGPGLGFPTSKPEPKAL